MRKIKKGQINKGQSAMREMIKEEDKGRGRGVQIVIQ
jgi:hypothetical protein